MWNIFLCKKTTKDGQEEMDKERKNISMSNFLQIFLPIRLIYQSEK
jgi:hypothetical protein